ncbi:glycosyltransferase family 8 protein [bacterium]|nr:glycosyltransferase family 8 protein [bacterium]
MSENNNSAFQTIHLIYACNLSYLPYTYVSILSVLKNKNEATRIHFHLICNQNIPKSQLERVIGLVHKYSYAEFDYIYIDPAQIDFPISINHISVDTYSRLLIPQLFPNLDKCIYLDGDTLILQDLTNYYNTDLDDNLIAGVIAPTSYLNLKKGNSLQKTSPYPEKFVNAGVIIMNLKLIRKQQIDKKFLQLAKEGYGGQDQQVINIACDPHIKLLPLKYNLQSVHVDNHMHASEDAKAVFKQNEIREAITRPVIIHFANKQKPWNNLEISYAVDWWQYARLSPFYERFMLNLREEYTNAKIDSVAAPDNKDELSSSTQTATKSDHPNKIKIIAKRILAKISINYRYQNYILDLGKKIYQQNLQIIKEIEKLKDNHN